jgi:hypothetical protein
VLSPESEVVKMAKKGKGKGVNHRSAITGRFVKPATAKRNPRTTVTEKR